MGEIELYYPSNSDDGIAFTERFCDQCKLQDPNTENPAFSCDIFLGVMSLQFDDPNYPQDWQWIEKDGMKRPTCVSHEYWDWEEKGNPKDPQNPNFIPPPNPNQLKLFGD
jgi:hypothetical protein